MMENIGMGFLGTGGVLLTLSIFFPPLLFGIMAGVGLLCLTAGMVVMIAVDEDDDAGGWR